MSAGRSVLLLVALLAILSLSSGCLSVSIGKVAYTGGVLQVQVMNTGGAGDAALQVNVFRFQDFRQVEVTRETLPIRLERGTGTYSLPLPLDDGSYRLYLYVTAGNDRRASVIQDITVESHGATPRIGAG
ncbi:MAG: hypothetical protein LUO97_04070 [Methanomicrobiales archaeon]|nr:hypothetical protein [Methanomicrobiales archaeon]MDD1668959.1 hypothetical protein [Methanomicrobiales archaeon]